MKFVPAGIGLGEIVKGSLLHLVTVCCAIVAIGFTVTLTGKLLILGLPHCCPEVVVYAVTV